MLADAAALTVRPRPTAETSMVPAPVPWGGLTDAHSLDSPVIYADGAGVTGGQDMQRKRRKRVGWAMESALIALCLAIFGVRFWIAVG